MITSVQNPAVRFARSLKEGKARRAAGAFLIEGEHMLMEAAKSGVALRHVFYDQARMPSHLWDICRGAGTELLDCAPHVLDTICAAKTPQGVAAVADTPAFARPSGAFIIALDGVQDPGNIGAILRTAEATGVSCVMLGEGCADPLGPKASQASMGSVFRVPLCPCASLRDALAALTCDGYTLWAAAQGGMDVFGIDALPSKTALIIGAEGRGVSAPITSISHAVAIPMLGQVESLNAAIAASVLMYRCARLGGRL